jgi:hypothetical protein
MSDELFNQIANISKAGAYDIVTKQRDELATEIEALKAHVKLLRETLELMLANFKANETFGTLPNKQELTSGINIMSEALNQTK